MLAEKLREERQWSIAGSARCKSCGCQRSSKAVNGPYVEVHLPGLGRAGSQVKSAGLTESPRLESALGSIESSSADIHFLTSIKLAVLPTACLVSAAPLVQRGMKDVIQLGTAIKNPRQRVPRLHKNSASRGDPTQASSRQSSMRPRASAMAREFGSRQLFLRLILPRAGSRFRRSLFRQRARGKQ